MSSPAVGFGQIYSSRCVCCVERALNPLRKLLAVCPTPATIALWADLPLAVGTVVHRVYNWPRLVMPSPEAHSSTFLHSEAGRQEGPA